MNSQTLLSFRRTHVCRASSTRTRLSSFRACGRRCVERSPRSRIQPFPSKFKAFRDVALLRRLLAAAQTSLFSAGLSDVQREDRVCSPRRPRRPHFLPVSLGAQLRVGGRPGTLPEGRSERWAAVRSALWVQVDAKGSRGGCSWFFLTKARQEKNYIKQDKQYRDIRIFLNVIRRKTCHVISRCYRNSLKAFIVKLMVKNTFRLSKNYKQLMFLI